MVLMVALIRASQDINVALKGDMNGFELLSEMDTLIFTGTSFSFPKLTMFRCIG